MFGKCPRARTAFRIRALADSIALVVQTARRISVSNGYGRMRSQVLGRADAAGLLQQMRGAP